jgi:hypothetical protein
MSKKKTYWVQMVKTIHVCVVATTAEEAEHEAKEDDEGFAYQGAWLNADAIVYDVSESGV